MLLSLARTWFVVETRAYAPTRRGLTCDSGSVLKRFTWHHSTLVFGSPGLDCPENEGAQCLVDRINPLFATEVLQRVVGVGSDPVTGHDASGDGTPTSSPSLLSALSAHIEPPHRPSSHVGRVVGGLGQGIDELPG